MLENDLVMVNEFFAEKEAQYNERLREIMLIHDHMVCAGALVCISGMLTPVQTSINDVSEEDVDTLRRASIEVSA